MIRARKKSDRKRLMAFHEALAKHYGPLHWWPGDTPFEVCVGAILTQNTAWSNVEKAIANLKREDLLSLEALLNAPRERIADLVRPSGYFNQKAIKLKIFVRFLADRYEGRVERMKNVPTDVLRAELLSI